MATRVKTTATPVSVPQSREAVVAAIAEIGRRQRERGRLEAAMNDEIAIIKARWEEQALPHGEAIRALHHGVQIWCEANRASLTDGGRSKTVALASGEIRWRVTPPKIVLKGVEAVLAALQERGLGRFIRARFEPNKEAMLAEPEAVAGVPGIRVEQHEEFVIVPHETSLEEVTV